MHAIISAARNNPARNKQLIADMRSQLDALVKGCLLYTSTTPYEVAPYAAGYTEVTIPYEEIGM